MRPKIKHIKNLYFRWGVKLKTDALIIAKKLESNGLIEFAELDRCGNPTHYRETLKMREIPMQVFEETIINIIRGSHETN